MRKPAVLGAVAAIYFLPSALAVGRKHRNRGALAALNLFTGWTLIGWVICLIWAVVKDPSSY